MIYAVKVPACGSIIQIDFGDGAGFVVMGLTDSILPTPQTKSVNETPDLDCGMSGDVGSEQLSQNSFTQYWDQQDTDHNRVDVNFVASKTDFSKRDVTVQEVSPSYTTGAPASTAKVATREYTAQIVSLTPEALTPQGYYKREVGLLRKSEITKTIA